MPRPQNIWDLLDPSHSEPSSLRFPFEGWGSEFGVFGWIYVAGYYEAIETIAMEKFSHLDNAAFDHVVHEIKTQTGAACALLPDAWKKELTEPGADWTRCSPGQIDKAVVPEPMRFDKLCLAILALEVTAKKLSPGFDVYSLVRLRPAIYKLDNLSHTDRALLANEAPHKGSGASRYGDLVKQFSWTDRNSRSRDGKLFPKRAKAFINLTLQGHATTLASAMILRDFLHEGGSRVVIRTREQPGTNRVVRGFEGVQTPELIGQ